PEPPPPPVPSVPVQPARAANASLGWKIGAIGVVLVLGVIFGTMVAAIDSGAGSNPAAVTTSPGMDVKSAFQQSFDGSFQRSCRASAMRSGNVSQSTADRYCECALSVFHETHSMSKVVEKCKQYAMR